MNLECKISRKMLENGNVRKFITDSSAETDTSFPEPTFPDVSIPTPDSTSRVLRS